MAAASVSPSDPDFSVEAPSWVRARRPVALRAGSAVPSRSLSPSMAAPVNCAQVYFFAGQPMLFAADGTMLMPMGEEATLPTAVTGVAFPPRLGRAGSTDSNPAPTPRSPRCPFGPCAGHRRSCTTRPPARGCRGTVRRRSGGSCGRGPRRRAGRGRCRARRRCRDGPSCRRRSRPGRADRSGRPEPCPRRPRGRGPWRWRRSGRACGGGGRPRPSHTRRASCDVPCGGALPWVRARRKGRGTPKNGLRPPGLSRAIFVPVFETLAGLGGG